MNKNKCKECNGICIIDLNMEEYKLLGNVTDYYDSKNKEHNNLQETYKMIKKGFSLNEIIKLKGE